MERNFGMRKILLLRPTRSDQYIAGPVDVSRIAFAMASIGTISTVSSSTAKAKSNERFNACIPASRLSCFLTKYFLCVPLRSTQKTRRKWQWRLPLQQSLGFGNIHPQRSC